MKHVFVINKISGKGSAFKAIPLIEKVCNEKKLDYMIEVTQYANHTKEIIEKYNNEKDITIYSVGGDGTFLETVNSINPDIPVGLIPCGSGNDFYRYFGGVNKTLEKNIKDTIEVKPKYIDIGQTDVMKYANTTSLGIDAKITFDASKMIRNSFITKGPAYVLSIIYNAIFLKSLKVKMTVDGVIRDGEYYIICLMNGSYYGNGAKAAPLAQIDDGYFDLILFKKANRIKTYKTLVKYLKGKATIKDGIETIRCKELIVDSNEDMICQSDGENYVTKHLDVKMLHNYLKLKVSK